MYLEVIVIFLQTLCAIIDLLRIEKLKLKHQRTLKRKVSSQVHVLLLLQPLSQIQFLCTFAQALTRSVGMETIVPKSKYL